MKKTVKQQVLEVLDKHNSISNIEALTGVHGFTTHKLSTVISDLKKDGHIILGTKILKEDGSYKDFIYTRA